jgi:hypothetical protein
MELIHLQNRLQSIYELELDHCIYDYLISGACLAEARLQHATGARESLLVVQDEGNLFLGLYLQEDVLNNLQFDDGYPHVHAGNLQDFLLALEGTSHFLYMMRNALAQRSVTRLEMEIQAEIDKFIVLSKYAASTFCQLAPTRWRKLLFDTVAYRSGLSEQEYQRYRDANYFAEKYCWYLESRNYLIAGKEWALLKELRRFYRLNLEGKLHRINQRRH